MESHGRTASYMCKAGVYAMKGTTCSLVCECHLPPVLIATANRLRLVISNINYSSRSSDCCNINNNSDNGGMPQHMAACSSSFSSARDWHLSNSDLRRCSWPQ
jgi:hypothetical protein